MKISFNLLNFQNAMTFNNVEDFTLFCNRMFGKTCIGDGARRVEMTLVNCLSSSH